jgi:hypothetical protein
MRSYLVVANQTLGGEHLTTKVPHFRPPLTHVIAEPEAAPSET